MDIPDKVAERLKNIFAAHPRPSNLKEVVQQLAQTAKIIFDEDGYHVPILFLYDNQLNPINLVSTQFDDQIDKFIFWRTVAESIETQNAFGMAWIAESWDRQIDKKFALSVPIRDFPIVGETLNILGIDRNDNFEQFDWKIVRESETSPPTLIQGDSNKYENSAEIYFLIPARRAMKLPDPTYIRKINK